ncbi:hypothetical protein [Deinococcus altitudinis]|uniref:hypothetical protein n=1 Tax=Deinococcus altitudinis TaxID=468914 RepID=UPI00389178B7
MLAEFIFFIVLILGLIGLVICIFMPLSYSETGRGCGLVVINLVAITILALMVSATLGSSNSALFRPTQTSDAMGDALAGGPMVVVFSTAVACIVVSIANVLILRFKST